MLTFKNTTILYDNTDFVKTKMLKHDYLYSWEYDRFIFCIHFFLYFPSTLIMYCFYDQKRTINCFFQKVGWGI